MVCACKVGSASRDSVGAMTKPAIEVETAEDDVVDVVEVAVLAIRSREM